MEEREKGQDGGRDVVVVDGLLLSLGQTVTAL
jgi:hypothetical protein